MAFVTLYNYLSAIGSIDWRGEPNLSDYVPQTLGEAPISFLGILPPNGRFFHRGLDSQGALGESVVGLIWRLCWRFAISWEHQ